MKREQEFVKNSVILSIGTIVPKLTSIITLPVVTACLTKAEYGTYDLITILVTLILPIATLQMQAAGFRYLIGVRGDREQQKKVITNILVFTVPVCIVTLAVVYFFLFDFSVETRILTLLYFFVDIMLTTVRQIARGLSLNLAYSISAIVNSVAEMVLVVVLLMGLDEGLNGALLALLLSQFGSVIFISVKAKIWSYLDKRETSMAQIKMMLTYSWPMVPNSLSSWVMRVSDRLLLTWFMGVEANAVYAVANKLPNMFSLVQSTFSLAWQENAALSVHDRDSGEYYGRMFDKIFRLLVGCMAVLIAFTPIIFRILIRGDYEEAYNHMPILYLAVMFSTISSYIGGIYIAHMKSKEIGITTTLAAVTNFLINIVCVNFIGIYAASLSTLISYFWLAVYRMFDVQKIQKINFKVKEIALYLILLAAMSFICFLRNPALDILNMAVSLLAAFGLNWPVVVAVMRMLRERLAQKRAGKTKKS